MFQPKTMDFSKIKTFSAQNRHNLVRIDNLRTPGAQEDNLFNNEEFDILISKLKEAKENGRTVTCFYGAHVIKCGLSRYLIWLMENGYITHLASNGAGSIHDFELAYLGGTSEHVPTAIEDGSFGMWEETGSWMNEAIKLGAEKNYGYGQSLADYVDNNPDKFPYRDDCVFYRAYKMGIPVTYHVTMGTDIIHQHPSVDFEALGKTSGIDFKYFCHSISMLGDKGVHLNIGSAVTGAEVFLKALSIARNQGHALKYITTANFDIIPLGDYKTDVGKDTFEYYYRPRKNIINRPVSLGGTGLYICGNHEQTIPSLYARLKG
ncbi:MAG: hypothetical protein IJM97_04195 [Clostridia bacterium]|nr:hypothetical protein [Clostridia bacterium]MBQ6708133.1 hypothetical protein [Clostridia bacterium]